MKHWDFERFTLSLPDDAVPACSHQGPCDDDVEFWHREVAFGHVSDQDLADELREYGAWDAEGLRDREENERRILWIAACNIREEQADSAT